MRGIGASLLVAGAYGAALLWQSWPLAAHVASALIDPSQGGGGLGAWSRIDIDLNLWIVAWVAHALWHRPSALFEGNVFHPAPDTLTASEHMLGLQPIAAPIFWATGNAVLTYNVTTLAIVWLTALCTFVAVRSWTRNAAVAFLAGAVFAFAPRVSGDFLRINYSAISLFPLVTWLAWRASRRPRATTLAALAATTALQIAAGIYVTFELFFWMIALAPALVLEARRGGRSFPTGPLAVMAAGAIVTTPLLVPYVRVRSFGGFPDFERALAIVVGTSPTLGTALSWLPQELGWPIVALAVVGVFGRGLPSRRLRLAVLAAGGLGFVLSCGTSLPGLYRFLMDVVPGFATIRAPSRFFVLPLLAAALLASFGAADLSRALRHRVGRERARVATMARAVIVVAALPFLVRPGAPAVKLAEVPAPGAWDAYRWLAEHGDGGVLLELPVYRSPLERGLLLATGRYMVGSTVHWLPLVNAYSGHPPPSAHLLSTLGSRLPDEQAFASLCSLVRLRWIVAHLDLMLGQREAWEREADRLPLRIAARFGDDVVYEVTARCGEREDRLRDEMRGERLDRSLGDVPLAPLPPEALRGRVDASVAPELTAGLLQPVEVTVTNESAMPWPGQTTREEGRVALDVRWRSPNGEVQEGDEVLLARDFAPGEKLDLTASVIAPRAGRWELEIGLVQLGRGWFTDLGGTGATRAPVETVSLPAPQRAVPAPATSASAPR